jgi:chloramphenicol-sensitive protein RarD
LFTSSLLICTNWVLFIYAVNNARTLEASFGYFISPLLFIGLGVLWLRERLTRVQAFALILAAVGVAVQLIALGHLPWISLTLAGSFSLYGLVRKRSPVGAISGLAIETLLALPAAIFGLWLFGHHGDLAFTRGSAVRDVLLLCAGVVTSVPLLCFVAGAQRIPLSLLGFLQYVAPSGQFLIAIFFIGEPINAPRLLSFALVWLALAILTAGSQIKPAEASA